MSNISIELKLAVIVNGTQVALVDLPERTTPDQNAAADVRKFFGYTTPPVYESPNEQTQITPPGVPIRVEHFLGEWVDTVTPGQLVRFVHVQTVCSSFEIEPIHDNAMLKRGELDAYWDGNHLVIASGEYKSALSLDTPVYANVKTWPVGGVKELRRKEVGTMADMPVSVMGVLHHNPAAKSLVFAFTILDRGAL